MNKTPTKQYFADALADQDGFLTCLRLMPNNVDTCKLSRHSNNTMNNTMRTNYAIQREQTTRTTQNPA